MGVSKITKIYLSFNNMAEYIELPVNPEVLSIETASNHKSYNLMNVGEVSVLDYPMASIVVLESFFPAQNSYFSNGVTVFYTPAECVDKIKAWRDSLHPMRLTVSGGAKDLSLPCSIERFDYWENWGENGDIYFRLELKEYKWYKLQTVASSSSGSSQNNNVRPSENQTPKTYVVKSGDSLWKICQLYLGDGSKYKEIARLNNISNPNLIRVGQVIRLS
jgi:LysM repeat protein